jgi:hypothetical protein
MTEEQRLNVEITVQVREDWWAEEAPLHKDFKEWTEDETYEFIISLWWKTYDLLDSAAVHIWAQDSDGEHTIAKP